MTKKFFHPSPFLLFLDPGSGMGKNQDPGSGINNPDPQHWRIQADPDPGQTLKSQKVEFLHEKYI